jgi:hypothetical protein
MTSEFNIASTTGPLFFHCLHAHSHFSFAANRRRVIDARLIASFCVLVAIGICSVIWHCRSRIPTLALRFLGSYRALSLEQTPVASAKAIAAATSRRVAASKARRKEHSHILRADIPSTPGARGVSAGSDDGAYAEGCGDSKLLDRAAVLKEHDRRIAELRGGIWEAEWQEEQARKSEADVQRRKAEEANMPTEELVARRRHSHAVGLRKIAQRTGRPAVPATCAQRKNETPEQSARRVQAEKRNLEIAAWALRLHEEHQKWLEEFHAAPAL